MAANSFPLRLPRLRAPAGGDASARPRLALAGAALLFLAAGAALLTATGRPYDGSPVVRASIVGVPAKGLSLPGWGLGPGALLNGRALTPAPIDGLAAPGPNGPLPIIAPNGRASWKAYARPFADDGRPKIALIVGGLGMNPAAAQAAIDGLPPEVTLSFTPYGDDLQALIDRARAAGHEVLLEIPMEPLDYPDNDPGPFALLSSDPPAEVSRRLDWLMSRGAGYFGVINVMGGRFLGAPVGMAAFTQVMRQRGVAFLDDGQAAARGGGLPRASAARQIDADLDARSIDQQLLSLEAQALQSGAALGEGFNRPLTITAIQHWAAEVGRRGYALAPASALMSVR